MTARPRKWLNTLTLFGGALVLGALLIGALSRGSVVAGAAPSRPRSWLAPLGWMALGGVATLSGTGVVASIVVAFGLYNVSALSQDSRLTFRAIHLVATRSISTRAKRLKAPEVGPQDVPRGLLLFDRECSRCHAAPGQPPEAFSEGMNPNPPPLVQTGRDWTRAEIYTAVADGIHMTGMPAFSFRLSDHDLWDVTAFVKEMPTLTVEQYTTMRDQAKAEPPAAKVEPEPHTPDTRRGRLALVQYNCNGCHFIPGIAASEESYLGPSLAGLGARAYIAGTLDNTPADLVGFIMHPQDLRPKGAMPDMRVTASDAADMAAYLRTLRIP